MKRLLSFVFALLCLVSVLGCSNTSDNTYDSSEAQNETTTVNTDKSTKEEETVSDDKPEIPAIHHADATFAFDTNLKEKEIYPLSHGGKTYYVAADGKSSNDGLSAQKPITLSDVAGLPLTAGDSVLFKKGDVMYGQVYVFSKSGDADNPITFASYGDGEQRPHITFGAGNAMVFSACSNIVVRDLEVSANGVDFSVQANPAYNCILFQYNFVYENKFENIYIVNNDVHSTDTEKGVMGISVISLEKDVQSCPREVFKNVYIYGNHVHDLGRSGIHTSGWLQQEQINQNNSLMDLSKNIYINNNHVHDVGNIGIYIAGCTNGSINRNLVYKTGMRKSSVDAEGECGIMALGADSIDIMFNVCYDNRNAGTEWDAMGIDIDWNTTNINVQYNYCYKNAGSGIGTMACQNSFIRNNRVENNLCATNQTAQIQISDFTSRYACVAENMHGVTNVTVSDNLIIGTPDGASMFRAQHFNGDTTWSKNTFEGNHVVYNGSNESDTVWISIDEQIPWYKFASNKYYGNNVIKFNCSDKTSQADVNTTDGARAYIGIDIFEAWQLRDLGSTFEGLCEDAPSAPTNGNIVYEGGKLLITWSASTSSVWHYNVYAVGASEEISYLNMLGESTVESFTYTPDSLGIFYIIIQPESDQGVYGQALTLKVELK